jgi:uncharacterized membrane protein YozB (DUF420 family)
MSIINPNAPLISDLNLILQILVGIVLLVAVITAKSWRKFKSHGTLMGAALILNTVSIVTVMIPSFLNLRGLFTTITMPTVIVIIHATLGTLIEVFSFWLVIKWMWSRLNIKNCAKRKSLMRITLIIWTIEFIIGIYLYIILYVKI